MKVFDQENGGNTEVGPRGPIGPKGEDGSGGGGAVDSVFGRDGVVEAESGDYDTDLVDETASKVYVSPAEKTLISTNQTDIAGKEDSLPVVPNDGDVLSSTIAGVRSWITPSSGGGDVDSVFGRTGVVEAVSGDYDSDEITETASRVFLTPAQKTQIGTNQTDITGKEPTITSGTTAQYWRGDKSFQTLDKAAVGLANVDNTSDANKPVSTDQQTEIDTKEDDLPTVPTDGFVLSSTIAGVRSWVENAGGGGSVTPLASAQYNDPTGGQSLATTAELDVIQSLIATADFEDTGFSNTAGVVTVANAGRYRIDAFVGAFGTSANYRWEGRISIYINGSLVKAKTGGYIRANTGQERTYLDIAHVIDLLANDEISIYMARTNTLVGNAVTVANESQLLITLMEAGSGGGGGGDVDSVFGRTGAVIAVSGDYDADEIAETATRVFLTPAEKTLIGTNETDIGTNATAITGKEPTITSGTTAQYWRGDKTFQTLDKAAVGLANVDNTSDASKPISTLTQTALDAKEPTVTGTTSADYYRGDKTFATLNSAAVGLGNVDNTSDANKPVSTDQQTEIDTKEDTVAGTTSADYYRGDKTFQTLDKAAVGLANVDNTSDASKPISTLTQSALDAKEATVTGTTSADYYRGDKTFQTLDKAAVGLANVDNTSDANKPVSTDQQTEIDTKEDDLLNPATTGFVLTSTDAGVRSWVAQTVVAPIDTVFGRTGAVVAVSGDYDADEITETAGRVFLTPAQKSEIAVNTGKISYTDAAVVATNTKNIDNILWTPDDLVVEPEGWWDASDTDSITESGNDVSQIDDQTSNARNFVQPTGSMQPETGNTLNGLNVLTFDNTTTDNLEILAFPIPTSRDLSVFSVQSYTTVSGGGVSDALFSMDSATTDWQITSNSATQFDGESNMVGMGGATNQLWTGGPFNGPSIYNSYFNRTGNGRGAYVDGVEVTTEEVYTTGMDTPQRLRVMANRGGAGTISGIMAEMIIVEDQSLETRQLIEGYLKFKWNLPALPSGHPFEFGPPTTHSAEIAANTAKISFTTADSDAVDLNTLKVTYDDAALVAGHTTDIGDNATDILGKEDSLPAVSNDGDVLSSTIAGVRSWITPSGGGGSSDISFIEVRDTVGGLQLGSVADGTALDMLYDQVDHNTDTGQFALSTNTIVITNTESKKYLVEATTSWNGTVQRWSVRMAIHVNGFLVWEIIGGYIRSSNGHNEMYADVSKTLDLVNGDVVKVVVTRNSGNGTVNNTSSLANRSLLRITSKVGAAGVAGPAGPAGTAFVVTTQAGNFTAVTGNLYLVDTNAARTVTMPSSPSNGDYFRLKDKTGLGNTNNITLARAGSESIEGVAANYIMQTDFGSLTLVSDGTDWYLING